MMREEQMARTFEKLNKEATWCRTCLKCDGCDIKESVAMEQRLVTPYSVKYVDVKVKCRSYIKDTKLPDNQEVLESLFSV